VETAFESSEFRQLVLKASDDSLNQALELFNVPGGVDVSLRGKPSVQSQEEVVRSLMFDVQSQDLVMLCIDLNHNMRYSSTVVYKFSAEDK